ncbi:hypothetical protein E1B28_006260 [Marasmius oreades]|uniref:Uncharacterized protein n=1 Tax=Marasmius oreades TaxID=181124 RepID=A0A9P7UV34_9AGAR|nr:uncharacterized protein E1B28_006260 [Marasmius oreades]KAG7095522.1 hypothetical protein E1B28_006260 [Marasmius oreades]
MDITITNIMDILSDGEECEELARFEKLQWIGRGVRFDTKTLPSYVRLYCAHELKIPMKVMENLFPSDSLPIPIFMSYKLPMPSQALIFPNSDRYVSSEPPNNDGTALASFDLPPKELVEKLRSPGWLEQNILDGIQSIANPSYPGDRFPLWSVEAWHEFYKAVEKQRKWRQCSQWLSEHARRPTATQLFVLEAQKYLGQLGWNESLDLPGSGTHDTTFQFSRLVSDLKIDGTLIDLMCHQLMERLENNELVDSELMIANRALMHNVNGAQKERDHLEPRTKYLKHLAMQIKALKTRYLVFPAFNEEIQHWLAFQIDFVQKNISYGDSLAHEGIQPPKNVLKKLKWWLDNQFGGCFEIVGDSLEHGRQDDYIVCGLLAVNTIAHRALGEPLWTLSRKVWDRVNWFNVLCKAHIASNHPGFNSPSRLPSPITDLHIEPQPLTELTKPVVTDAAEPSSKTSVDDLDCFVQLDVSPMFDSKGAGERKRGIEEVASSSPSSPPSKKVCLDCDDYVTVVTLDPPLSATSDNNEDYSSDAASDGEEFEPYEIDFIRSLRPPGSSKSATWSRSQRELYHSDPQHFSPIDSTNVVRLKQFRTRILQLCSSSEVLDAMHVRHVKCGRELTMKDPFNTGNYKTHLKTCPALKGKKNQNDGAEMYRLTNFFQPSTSQGQFASVPTRHTTRKLVEVPCGGLTSGQNPLIDMYIDRTGAEGGGARSVNTISVDIYGKRYRYLSSERKQRVKHLQRLSQVWKIDRQRYCIYSSNCTKVALVDPSSPSNSAPACASCFAVSRLKVFKNAISIARPLDKNYKYLNHEYQNKNLGSIYARAKGLEKLIQSENSSTTVCAIYVTEVLEGKHSGNRGDEFFGSLLQAMLVKRSKAERGVGLQNFRHAPDLIQIAHMVQMHSTVAYQFLREYMPLPTVRALQQLRSKEPSFPLDIEEETFVRAAHYLSVMAYNGPVALSCDDTKLLPALRPYYDKPNDCYYVIGAVGKPLILGGPDEFRDIVKEGVIVKATKLRLWCLQIPLPGVPTIVLAAKAIPGNLNAATLTEYSWEIISGLLRHGINVRSYACDGAATERAVQRNLHTKATTTKTVGIHHPGPCGNKRDLEVTIHFYDGHPIAFVQDSKHGLKTIRNNLFSGSKCLTFPNDVALYSQVRDIYLNDGPIFRRDWDRYDKQDDAAATRLTSGATLEWLTKHSPSLVGLIIYLFVFGELVDAYESRLIDIHTRVRMVLRAYYFLEIWIQFLQATKYPLKKHCISHEAIDIINTLVHGFLESVIIYRDHVKGQRPFLPWRIGSGPCERVFGKCRRLVKDFMMVQFFEMVPKLFIGLREEALASRFSDGKETVSGYSHTDLDCRGMDLRKQRLIPSDDEINEESVLAYGDAENLWTVLGATAADIHTQENSFTSLPHVLSWYSENTPNTQNSQDSEDSEDSREDILVGDSDWYNRKFSNIQDALDEFDRDLDLSPTEDHRLMALRYAAIAEYLDQHMRLNSLPELSNEGVTEALSDDGEYIGKILADSLPTVNHESNTKPSNFFERTTTSAPDFSAADFSELVKQRFEHQTEQAKTGGRGVTGKTDKENVSGSKEEKKRELSQRQKIMRELELICSEQEVVGVGTGVERKLRWTARDPAPGGRNGVVDGEKANGPMAGNSANAALSATAVAKKKLAARKDVWAKKVAKLPKSLRLGDAGVSPETPLTTSAKKGSGYGYAFVDKTVVLCQVLAIYCKGGGKNGKHEFRTESSNISAVSYLVVQLYDEWIGTRGLFRAIHNSLEFLRLRAKKFALLPSSFFLCILDTPAQVHHGGIKVSENDWSTFCKLRDGKENIITTLSPPKRGSKGRQAAATVVSDESEEE